MKVSAVGIAVVAAVWAMPAEVKALTIVPNVGPGAVANAHASPSTAAPKGVGLPVFAAAQVKRKDIPTLEGVPRAALWALGVTVPDPPPEPAVPGDWVLNGGVIITFTPPPGNLVEVPPQAAAVFPGPLAPAAVPEPSALALAGAGLAGLAMMRRKMLRR